MLSYFHLLYHQFENKHHASLPQSGKTHTKEILQGVLKILSRTGLRLGGWSASRAVLVERISTWVNIVVEKGRASQTRAFGSDELDEDPGVEHSSVSLRKQLLNLKLRGHAEMPADAIVEPVQAASVFRSVQATALDEADLKTPDAALRSAEDALFGHHINPQTPEYPCAAIVCSAGLLHAIRWHPPLIPRKLTGDDFACSKEGIQKIRSDFNECAMGSAGVQILSQQVASLDATQQMDVLRANQLRVS